MRIEGTSTLGIVQPSANGGMQSDSYTKNIQNQINKAQQELQDISSNKELSLEAKMKKRQEIQQEISTLNQQLRQHQLEQRKEQQNKNASMDEMAAGSKNVSDKNDNGISQASMQAIISADSSMKQASAQGSTAVRMEGKAGVLESEIKLDAGRGGNTEKKEQELADIQQKAQSATAAQISTLADADGEMKKAANADNTKSKEDKTDTSDTANTPADIAEQTAEEKAYKSIDIKL